MKIEWKETPLRSGNGVHGYLGKYKIFEVFYDGVTKSVLPYTVTCDLPGLKPKFQGFESQEQGQKKAAQLLKFWLQNTGLEFNNETN